MTATLLLVDSDPLASRAFERGLRRLGYDVIISTPETAETVLRDATRQVDIVVVDEVETVGLTHDLARRLAVIRSDVRMVVTSGWRTEEGDVAWHREGVAGVIEKPYSVSELAVALEQAINPTQRKNRQRSSTTTSTATASTASRSDNNGR